MVNNGVVIGTEVPLLLTVILVLIGLAIASVMVKLAPAFEDVHERPFFFGGIYALAGGAFFLIGWLLTRLPVIKSGSYGAFVVISCLLLFLFGVVAIFSSLVLVIKCGIFRGC